MLLVLLGGLRLRLDEALDGRLLRRFVVVLLGGVSLNLVRLGRLLRFLVLLSMLLRLLVSMACLGGGRLRVSLRGQLVELGGLFEDRGLLLDVHCVARLEHRLRRQSLLLHHDLLRLLDRLRSHGLLHHLHLWLLDDLLLRLLILVEDGLCSGLLLGHHLRLLLILVDWLLLHLRGVLRERDSGSRRLLRCHCVIEGLVELSVLHGVVSFL